MNSDREYAEFYIKFTKHLSEIQNEYEKLSPRVQYRIAQDASVYLRLRGLELTADTLMTILRKS